MSECIGEGCDHSSHQKTEAPKLTEQVLNEQPPKEDNLVVAERMIEQILPMFYQSLESLSKKETARLIKLIVQFPFVDVKKFKLNDKQKVAFMFAERLVYANMVKRARAELDRTFGEVQKEMEKTETKKENDNV
jgi:hypothetical protein